tara:strand:+ start:668 stop:814 length:147 start_codon:yes stop_codon:yes gene_type:complete
MDDVPGYWGSGDTVHIDAWIDAFKRIMERPHRSTEELWTFIEQYRRDL